jgi:hypothetical protein
VKKQNPITFSGTVGPLFSGKCRWTVLCVPEATGAALPKEAGARNASARREWEKLRPGRRRGLPYHIASAKTEPTREKRIRGVPDGLLALKFRAAGWPAAKDGDG